MKERNEEKRDKYWMIIVILAIFLLSTIIGVTILAQTQLKKEKEEHISYQRHYMFISQTGNRFITQQIYKDAKEYGKQKGVYVDKLNDFSEYDYNLSDYLNMAMAMQVDGIILEGSDEDEVRMAVNKASNMGIAVVTVLSDCVGSRRKSYITMGDYNLGREYGRQIISITKVRTPRVVLLVDEDSEENEGQVLTGIRETLRNEGNHLQPELWTERLGSGNGQAAQKKMEWLVDEENRPDILLCMNEKDTKMVYQSLIDYDLVGKVLIIGFCESESLLKAVKEGNIAALIHMDTEQAGILCLDALNYYLENGSVNDTIIVDDTVITNENVERYMGNE